MGFIEGSTFCISLLFFELSALDHATLSIQEVSAVVVLFLCGHSVVNAVLMELVDEVSLVGSQRLFIVESRNALISNEINKVHFLVQFEYCFLMLLTAGIAAFGARTVALTTHADKE
jgi:hypothetical protein